MSIKSKKLTINDMHCADCENVIENALQPLPGIHSAKADFASESLKLEYDNEIIALTTICAAINSAGYRCGKYHRKSPTGLFKRLFYIMAGLAGIALLFELESSYHVYLF